MTESGRNLRALLFTFLAGVSIVGLTVVLVKASEAEDQGATVFHSVNSAPVEGLAERFSVLKAKNRETSDLRSDLEKIWKSSVSRTEGETVSVGTIELHGNRSLMVAGNDKGICVSDQSSMGDAVSACATPRSALSGELVLVSACEPGLTDGDVRVLGLVPDGIDAVLMAPTGATSKRESAKVSVESNVFEAIVDPIDSNLILGGSKEKTAALHLPLEKMALGPNERCVPPVEG